MRSQGGSRSGPDGSFRNGSCGGEGSAVGLGRGAILQVNMGRHQHLMLQKCANCAAECDPEGLDR